MQKVKEKSNWKGETIVEIEIERLKAFRNHPFQVRDDDDLEKLKESIKMYGILTPLLSRLSESKEPLHSFLHSFLLPLFLRLLMSTY